MAVGYSRLQYAAAAPDLNVRTRASMDRELAQLAGVPAFGLGKDAGLASVAIDWALRDAKTLDGAETCSRPPSPPESGTTTPRLRIGPCPPRLWPYYPPPNYGCVSYGTLYRSSYPQERNMDFVKSLRIRSILTLVETEPTPGYEQWVEGDKIKRVMINIATNKECKVDTTLDSLCEALLFVLDSSNFPVYIHCNQGKHRTGCVVACLRKIQRWPIEEIIREYVDYAWPKARDGDISLIKSFDPNVVFEYATRHGYLDGSQPRVRRLDSGITNIDAFVSALASGAFGDEPIYPDWNSSSLSATSTASSDGPIEISVPAKSNSKMEQARSRGVDTTMIDACLSSARNATGLSVTEVEHGTKIEGSESVAPQEVTIVDGSNGAETTWRL